MTIGHDPDPDTVAVVANKVTQFGAATSIAGWLTVNEIVALGGLLLALGGFIINWAYRHRADRREERLLQAQLQHLQDRGVKDEHDPT